MSEYHSFKNTLDSLGYSLLTDIESFGVVGRVKFECNGGHQNDLAKSTFYKKQKELERTGIAICAKCNGVTKGSPRKGDDEVSARTMRRRQEEKKLPPAIPVVPRHFTSRMTIEQKFDVFLNFLQSQGYTMDSDFDGFSGGRRIQWTCNNGHSEDWKLDTFSKTKKKCEETGSILCKKCIGSKAGRPSGITPTSTDSAYNAYKRFLESIGYKIVIDFDTFTQSSDKDTSRQVVFVCDQGHETTVAAAVFNRKRRGYEKDGIMLCNDCTGRGKPKDVDVKLEDLKKIVFEMNGHHVIANNGMVVSHKCGLCDEMNESWESNIRSKTTLHCRKCKNSETALQASVSRPVKKPEFGIGVFLNFKKYLEEHGYEMVSDFEIFKENKMSFRCDEGHITTMKVTSFNNRKHSDLIKGNIKLLCHDCNCKGESFEDKLVDLMNNVKLKTGHNVLTLGRNRVVTFKCGTCGNVNKSSSHNLTRSAASRRCNVCVENPMHNPESVYKLMQTSFSKKTFEFPSGRIDMVMGYEPLCLSTLLNFYDENDIITDCRIIPTFKYRCLNDDGTERDALYYPDIQLPDKIIEVKSTWTFEKEKINNLRKFQAVADSGYKLECWIYDGKKNTRPDILEF
ncbi:Csr/MutH/archaeal HJR family nuclease [Armadillidium vulgare iridescent virus]|uniref:Csr/MutH/archaeal HJR family nuclease n=1 Tax=Armadillidium vulgare iridescent virus TaxID=72201 RepID=A0A068QKF1_9VIRU|nr:Csr/MutH/archaeal HJR family nuclease [Armadillidium vulgare iridescent virus]CCV02507.1 Csr/MutH/archaeal HJR family nuclease [Armadillidium vulgare iridescent virus]